MLFGAVENRADAGLTRTILHPEARQPREPGVDLALIVELVTVLAGELGPVVRIGHGGVALDEGMLAWVAGFAAVVALLEQFAGTGRQRFGRVVGEEDAERMVVVHRHPGVAAEVREFRLRRRQ